MPMHSPERRYIVAERCFYLGYFVFLAFSFIALGQESFEETDATEKTPDFKPPYGLFWGENEIQVRELLAGVKATTVNTRVEANEEIWEVTGLVQDGLKQAVFVFDQGALAVVELDYPRGNWNAARCEDFFWRLHHRIDGRFGKGVLFPASNNDWINKSSVSWGYEWKETSTTIDELTLWSLDAGGYHEAVAIRYEMRQPLIVYVPVS